ncbi:TPA: amino acid ABC transporter permease/ATP-binding protein [Klebsiella oxytoca]
MAGSAGMMTTFTDWDIVRNLLLAGRWTVLLSLVAFFGGALVTLPLLLLRMTGGRQIKRLIRGYVELFQGTPLLMQLFLAFFGVALFGIDVSAWTAASLALTLYTSAFLLDIWFGSIRALPKGQWEASRCLGLSFGQTLYRVVAPQALRIAIAPTVGFAVQVIKGTALASIIGRSGSGKSTLLRCINGLEGYQDGSIKLGGMTITDRDSQAREISRSIGMVFQNFNLFPHMTALENVMLAPRRVLKKSAAECRELAQRMLEKVGLGDRLDYYPSSLSGGQQQRVAIARALAMSPKVLLCDEITSALDPELVGEVLKVLEQLAAEGMTLILVTHEMNFAREVGDRVVFMHQGRVWEQGDSKTLFANPQTSELKQFISSVRGLNQ